MKGAPAPHITIDPARARVRVTVKGEVIADSRDAVALKEGDYPVVYYFPRKDVKMERLERTDLGTYCPYKGQASYWSLALGETVVEDVAWSYRTPLPESQKIAGLVCFYPEKVDLYVDGRISGEPPRP